MNKITLEIGQTINIKEAETGTIAKYKIVAIDNLELEGVFIAVTDPRRRHAHDPRRTKPL